MQTVDYYKAESGLAIVMNIQTGQILSSVSCSIILKINLQLIKKI